MAGRGREGGRGAPLSTETSQRARNEWVASRFVKGEVGGISREGWEYRVKKEEVFRSLIRFFFTDFVGNKRRELEVRI